ncbi:MAG: leucyl/phenylalanyl-tRNA--protein transferase [Myxococcales bacterium]|nr:leucyl/phenylalanyl-tRNA--protein transferase [Myxococcales bacterium]
MRWRPGPYWLGDEPLFPPAECAHESGLVAVGGRLEPEWLLTAYRQGIFPWPSSEVEPMLWFSPDPRCVLVPSRIHVSRKLARTLRRETFTVRFDSDFEGVIRACGQVPRPDQDGTWVTEPMIAAYRRLHALGHAHSVETWRDGRLVGGIYGVALGGAFFGESMFHRESDASKVAMVALARRLEAWGYAMLDCQVENEHLLSMGAESIPRGRFLEELAAALRLPGRPAPWPTEP